MMRTKFKGQLLMWCMACLMCAALTACGGKNWHTAEGAVWHTTYRIVYHGDRPLEDSIVRVMAEVEESLSPFMEGSRISRINRNETDMANAMIAKAFEIAERVNKASEGRFDPTVAPLVNLWGFGTDKTRRALADSVAHGSALVVTQAEIDSALALVGIDSCAINEHFIVKKKHEGTTFNFSSITKGLGCDMVAAMLRRNGVTDYMVEIGGEVAAHGHNQRHTAWMIQIDSPEESLDAPVHDALSVIPLEDCAVASSGNYRNFHDTKRYGRVGHTIDPITGMPVKGEVLASTIVAPTCGEADAWATACMAVGDASKVISMIDRQPDVEAMIVVARGDSVATLVTEGFPKPVR